VTDATPCEDDLPLVDAGPQFEEDAFLELAQRNLTP
jgi:hypothetical protein